MGVQYRMLTLEWAAPSENTAPIDGYKILFQKDEVLHQLAICDYCICTTFNHLLVAPSSDILAGGADLPRAGTSRTDWRGRHHTGVSEHGVNGPITFELEGTCVSR